MDSASPREGALVKPLDADALALLFSDARTHSAWQSTPVGADLLQRLYELARMGPTSANSQPLRLVFVVSKEAKQKLAPHLMPNNVEKTMTAPVTAIVAYDSAFYEEMPALFPARPELREFFASLPADKRNASAYQSATLQAGYLILAARALGLDVGPMAGFDVAGVDAAFFPDGRWRTTLLVNLGYGDPRGLFPRNPRLAFERACRIE